MARQQPLLGFFELLLTRETGAEKAFGVIAFPRVGPGLFPKGERFTNDAFGLGILLLVNSDPAEHRFRAYRGFLLIAQSPALAFEHLREDFLGLLVFTVDPVYYRESEGVGSNAGRLRIFPAQSAAQQI